MSECHLGVVKLCAHKELIDMAKGSIGKHLPPFTRLNLLFLRQQNDPTCLQSSVKR